MGRARRKRARLRAPPERGQEEPPFLGAFSRGEGEPGGHLSRGGGYRLLGGVYQHRSAGHSEEYVSEEGAHCNTAEAEVVYHGAGALVATVSRHRKALSAFVSPPSQLSAYLSRLEPNRADTGDDRFPDTRCFLGEKTPTDKNDRERLVARLLKLCVPFYPRAFFVSIAPMVAVQAENAARIHNLLFKESRVTKHDWFPRHFRLESGLVLP